RALGHARRSGVGPRPPRPPDGLPRRIRNLGGRCRARLGRRGRLRGRALRTHRAVSRQRGPPHGKSALLQAVLGPARRQNPCVGRRRVARAQRERRHTGQPRDERCPRRGRRRRADRSWPHGSARRGHRRRRHGNRLPLPQGHRDHDGAGAYGQRVHRGSREHDLGAVLAGSAPHRTANAMSRRDPSHRTSTRARRRSSTCLATLAAVLGIVSAPEHARAQADVNPPLPNVMLLVDTSGSMEYKIGSDQFPVCSPAGGQSSTEKSRWIELLEVLTGTISDYRCQRIDRTAQSFATGEYGSGGPLNRTPYHYLYQNPYHRPLSGTCAPAPGALDPTNAYAWPAGAITFHEYLSPTSSCTFRQSTDGILDSFERAVRFGLMT